MKTFVEIFGWYGTVAIVIAYALVSFSVIESTNIWYQILNATGALGILIGTMLISRACESVLQIM